MKDVRFEDAFPSVPPMVHARVEDALREVKTVKQAKPISALVLAAVILMALASAAYAAARSSVLDFVFRSGTRTEEQMSMVQPVGVSHKAQGVTTTVTDAIVDGRKLSVALEIETETPFYVITDSVTVNGVELFMNDSNLVNMWIGNEYALEHADGIRGFSGTLDETQIEPTDEAAIAAFHAAVKRMEDGIADVRVHLTYLVPQKKLVPISGAYDTDSRKAWKAIDECVAAGNTPIEKGGAGYIWVDSAWMGAEYADGIQSGSIPAAQFPIGDAQAHIDHSNMRALDSFEIAFTLDAKESGKLDRTPKDGINDARMHIAFDEVSFSPVESTFNFTITPDGMTMDEIVQVYRHFTFYGIDENGQRNPLPFEDMFYEGTSSRETLSGGIEALRVCYKMPALAELPAIIAMVPYNESSTPEDPLWEYAIYFQGN